VITKFASLRDYLAGLDRLGDLQHVMQKIDWNVEAAAAIRHSAEHPLLAFTPSTGPR
jgi:3-polyprenyl-4-hydroxybenzoate decarboxylase